jgi:AcrR family transcriptional regulator
MASGPEGAGITDVAEVRLAAEAVIGAGEVRFERGVERPLGAKGRRTRARILRGASETFAELGWGASTIGAIAQRTGVGAGTMYQYFRSKEDVLAALVGESTLAALDQIRAWDPADGRAGLADLLARFVRGYAATAPFQAVWAEVSHVDPALAALRTDLTEVYVGLFAGAFAAGREAGLLDAGPDPVEAARALTAMVDRYCHQAFVERPGSTTPAAAAALLTDLWAAAIRLR